ncbi:MAG: hypothetical protein V1790_15920, partial [Planctomycetota bacterium]
MKLGTGISGWRSLVGVLGVAVLALGLSLKLEGAPSAPRPAQPGDKATTDVARETTPTRVEPLFAGQTPTAVPAGNSSRVTAGSIPATGLGVIATVYVDWRDDEGTRLRQAGKLIGPMPYPGDQAGGVADGGWYPHGCAVTDPGPGKCSFAVDCDDNDLCTADRCDFVFGSAACTGRCVNDPIANNSSGGCDDGLFCNGRETCRGAKCTVFTAPNVVNQPCDSHASCGEDGTCNMTDHVCTAPAGRIGDACGKNEDCNVAGRCLLGPTPGAPCDSDATCGGGTCTVLGYCGPGTCANGIPAICCDEPLDPTVCADQFPRCDETSVRPGIGCAADPGICKDGLCERCQPSCNVDADCADGVICNGVETCLRTCVGGTDNGKLCPPSACPGGSCLGQCRPGLNPCGTGARCAEKKCGDEAPPIYCLSDRDCPRGVTCNDLTVPPPPLCFFGRCCDPDSPDACSILKLAVCKADANSLWYMDDDGEQQSIDPCGGWNPTDLLKDPFGCPKYSSGIVQHVKETPPIYPVRVGPISDSRVCAPAPGGPGGACPVPFGAGLLYALGDDYKVPNSSYLQLEVVRFVFNVVNTSRLSLDVYDKSGNFVEDVNVGFQSDLTVAEGIVVVIFRAPLTIPPEGWIVLRVSERFIPNSRAFWLSTTTTAGIVGTNYPNALWINGYPGLASTVSNNFLQMCVGGPRANQACVTDADCLGGTCGTAPGILAFELSGDKVTPPIGACCDSDTGECVDGVESWVCVDQGMVYHGDGTLCGHCTGGPNTGQNCRTCSNATSTFCGEDADCPTGGHCQVDNSKCPSTEYTCSTGNTNITECNVCSKKKCTGARVCSNKQCSGLPANTVCTGTGQGTCPLGQTCNFIPCSADATCTPTGGTCPAVVTVCTGTG